MQSSRFSITRAEIHRTQEAIIELFTLNQTWKEVFPRFYSIYLWSIWLSLKEHLGLTVKDSTLIISSQNIWFVFDIAWIDSKYSENEQSFKYLGLIPIPRLGFQENAQINAVDWTDETLTQEPWFEVLYIFLASLSHKWHVAISLPPLCSKKITFCHGFCFYNNLSTGDSPIQGRRSLLVKTSYVFW